jgi:YD repeat-containing protein
MEKQTRRTFLAILLAALAAWLGIKRPARAAQAAASTPVLTTAEPGSIVSVYSYDALGRLTSVGDSWVPVCLYNYDAAGRSARQSSAGRRFRALGDWLRKQRRQEPPQS